MYNMGMNSGVGSAAKGQFSLPQLKGNRQRHSSTQLIRARNNFCFQKRIGRHHSSSLLAENSVFSRPRTSGHISPRCLVVPSAMEISTEASKKALVVVGSANADLVVHVGRLPLPGETMAATEFNTFPGGKGANQATAAGKLSYPTQFIGQFGDDGSAAMLKQSLNSSGVDCGACRDVPKPTGTAIIMLQPSGENSIVIVGGANQAEWVMTDQIKQRIQGAGMVLLQREIPESVNAEVAKIANEAGVPVVLDAGGQEGEISEALLAHITVISPNETELMRMTGMPTDDEEQITAAAEVLFKKGVETVLCKLGSKGSLMLQSGGQPLIRQQAMPVDKVVDTTGAGDCFTAAWAVGRLEGQSPKDAMAFASAAAAICVQGLGATTSLPSRTQVDELFTPDSNF